jgi:hypothetical protein
MNKPELLRALEVEINRASRAAFTSTKKMNDSLMCSFAARSTDRRWSYHELWS